MHMFLEVGNILVVLFSITDTYHEAVQFVTYMHCCADIAIYKLLYEAGKLVDRVEE